MHPLEVYYLRHGSGQYTGIGPIFCIPPFLERGHGIGNFFGSLFRWVKPILCRGAVPRICDAMCYNGQYGRSDSAFRLNTTVSYRIATLYMEKHNQNFKDCATY